MKKASIFVALTSAVFISAQTFNQSITVEDYSPTVFLKRNSNAGGYLQGVKTQLQDGTDNWFFGNFGTNQWMVSKGDWTNKKLLITEAGNVGIGTPSPNSKLHVQGDINSTGGGILNIAFNATDKTNEVSNYGMSLQGIYPIGSSGNFGPGVSLSGYFGLSLNTVSTERVRIDDAGNVGIGTSTPQYRLDVNGKSSFADNMKVNAKIEAKEIKVTLTPTADFVFENDYHLPKLEDVEKHIKEKKHLPEIASAKEMKKEGVNVGEFQIKLLQKIEELTLYTIEQNKLLKEQNQVIKDQQKRIEILENKNK